MKSYPQFLLVLAVAAHLASARAADIIISEIMYHPVSEDVREEFIELYNRGGEAVNLAGWNFTGGIRFVFSDLLLPPGEFVVAAADVATFRNKHGSAARVAGNWEGMLSNSDEDIDFNDSNGDRADSVHYADEGDWAVRTRGPLDRNHRGWIWVADHDGGGKSLELINPALSNNRGQNWAASLAAGGTPGRPNSVHRADLAPMILDGRHFPIIPKPSDAVAVTARIEDERRDELQVFVWHRTDGAATFTRLPMADDGAHSDGAADDRYFGAVLPPHSNGTITEFYFEAVDAGGNRRFWPAPVRPEEQNLANLLYQVRDSNYSSATPLYLLIMREVERAELHALIDDLPDAHTDAQMNGTFISVDSTGTHLRYLVGIRNRGHGSRTARPNNFRVNFPTDQPWNGRTAINLNSQYPHAQLIGSVLFQEAGLPAPDAWIIQLRVNNSNPALTTSPQFDHYVAVEAFDTDFTRRHFPGDSAGNVYRGVASDPPEVGEADLVYRGENPDIYRRNYKKETNVSEDNWTDLIELTRVLTQSPAETYAAEVMRVTDVHEWLRYFAINALLDNNETGIYNGYGDDYGLYRGRNNVRFQMLPYDHDTIMGQGFEKGRTDASIFRAANLAVLDRLLRGAEFQPFYVGHLHGMIGTIFSRAELEPMLDRLLGDWVPATTTSAMKTFAAARNTFVSSIVPSLVPFTAFWRFNGSGANLGADWREPGFDDSAWPAGKGLLYFEPSGLPAPKNTRLPEGRDIYYFRTQFWLHPVTAPLLAGVKLRLTTILDDGAVVYLNGRELLRVGMPEGQAGHGVFSDRVIGNATLEGPFLLPADALSAGVNILAVELHQSDPQSSDAVFGMTLDLFVPPNPSANHPIQISEVFAHNVSLPAPDGSLADWVELHNPSDSDINLEQLSLTDNSSLPRQWVFPAGARVPARGYAVIRFDSTTPATSANTGFGLSRSGDEVYLFDRPDRGGLLLDSIRFGIQAPDLSLARNPAGGNQWLLAQPTPGGPNTVVDLGDAGALRINEWMADPAVGPDWFEVFNSSARAIALGGLYLSDSTAARTQFAIAPHSYIAPFQFVKFEADDDPFQGANHLNFKLSAAGETLGIFDGSGNIIDTVTFGSQPTGSSEGRLPDGASTITRFVQATPGASNRIAPVAPRMQILRRNDSAVIQFPGVAGTSYTIQYCESVTLAPWLKLKDVAAADTGTQEVIDAIPGGTRRFYRIVTPSLP